MQLSYAPILGYSFDSTKVAKPIRRFDKASDFEFWHRF